MKKAPQSEYILGSHDAELARLQFQHQAWIHYAYKLFQDAGVRSGDAVLDLGCGPGLMTRELAHIVGPRGRVIGFDRSERFLRHLESEVARVGLTQVETLLGEAEQLELPAGSLDAVYTRWFLCWPEEPVSIFRRAARGLKPGGVAIIHDYLDWGAMQLVPPSKAFRRGVQGCMRSWEAGGGTIDIGQRLTEFAEAAELNIELFRPVARLGRVGSLEWEWMGEFFEVYLPRVVEAGLLSDAERVDFAEDWRARASGGIGYCTTPTVFEAVLRKPLTAAT